MHNDDVAANALNEPADQNPICDYPGCAITAPHYHRETPDGEEIVRAEPVDQATAEHEQITPPPAPQGFADHRSIEHLGPDVQQAMDNFVNADGSVIDAVAEIEQLARRIAIDMLESREFENHIEAAIITRALGIAKRTAFELLRSREFHAKVMDIAWPKVHPGDDRAETVYTLCKTQMQEMLDSAELKDRIINVTKLWHYSERGKTASAAEVSLQCDHQWADDPKKLMQNGKICRRCGATQTGKTRPDAERHPDAQIVAPPSEPATTQPKPSIAHSQIAKLPCDVPEDADDDNPPPMTREEMDAYRD